MLPYIIVSAHWCPPCRMFTPKLRQIYLGLKNQGKDFEVVFCSCDQGPMEFNEYFGTMPWKAIPFENDAIRQNLSDQFNVDGIPTLLLIDEESGMYNSQGRSLILGNPSGFPWK